MLAIIFATLVVSFFFFYLFAFWVRNFWGGFFVAFPRSRQGHHMVILDTATDSGCEMSGFSDVRHSRCSGRLVLGPVCLVVTSETSLAA